MGWALESPPLRSLPVLDDDAQGHTALADTALIHESAAVDGSHGIFLFGEVLYPDARGLLGKDRRHGDFDPGGIMDNEHLALEGGAGDIHQLDGIFGDALVPLGKAGLFGDLSGLHHSVPGTDLSDLLLGVAEIGQEFGGAGLHHRVDKEIPGGGRRPLADDIHTGIHKEAQNPQCGAEHSQNPEQQRGLFGVFSVQTWTVSSCLRGFTAKTQRRWIWKLAKKSRVSVMTLAATEGSPAQPRADRPAIAGSGLDNAEQVVAHHGRTGVFPVFKDKGTVGGEVAQGGAGPGDHRGAQQPQLGGEAPQEPVHQGKERHIQHGGTKAHREKAEDLPVDGKGIPEGIEMGGGVLFQIDGAEGHFPDGNAQAGGCQQHVGFKLIPVAGDCTERPEKVGTDGPQSGLGIRYPTPHSTRKHQMVA